MRAWVVVSCRARCLARALTLHARSAVSPFLYKTYNLVSDPSTDHIVSWAADGRTFTVHKPDAMARAARGCQRRGAARSLEGTRRRPGQPCLWAHSRLHRAHFLGRPARLDPWPCKLQALLRRKWQPRCLCCARNAD